MSEHMETPPPVPAEPVDAPDPGAAPAAPAEESTRVREDDRPPGEGGEEGADLYDGGDIPPAPADMVSDAESQQQAHEDRVDANLE